MNIKSILLANAIEDALSRVSAEQRAETLATIEEARRNIKLISIRDDITPADANSISKNAQAIEEAKRAIPFETMKDVDNIGSPLNTPSPRGYYNSTVVELHSNTLSNIEGIEQGNGNNYLRENAIDRAIARPSQEVQEDRDQQALGR